MVMPRLTGREAMREILNIDPHACVLFTSGYSEEPIGPDAELACGFIGKPYRPDDLARAVRSAIDQARAKKQSKRNAVPASLLA